MNENTNTINYKIAKSLAGCSSLFVCLMLLKMLNLFSFEGTLFGVIIAGFVALLTPITLYKLKVSDRFLKYYMSILVGLIIGSLGCFRGIGIYITFVLVPVVSCLYFDTRYTIFCSIYSYVIMGIAVYFNTADKMEVQYLGWSHFITFRAYMIGFTLEYIAVAVFLANIMMRARALMAKQHEAYLMEKAQDARYQLLIRGTKDIVFEYYPKEDRYTANRSIWGGTDNNEPVEIYDFQKIVGDNPRFKALYDHFTEGFREDKFDTFEVDLTYEKDGRKVPLWYMVECFIVRDNDIPVSIIGEMHDITRVKESQAGLRKNRLANIYNDGKRENSIYEQVLSEVGNFTEEDFVKLADGHRFLAEIMEDIKYSENLVLGINKMISQIGSYFGVDRICVVETDMASGICHVNYQWNSKPENYIENYFSSISMENIKRVSDIYDTQGYIEVNPSNGKNLEAGKEDEFYNSVIYGVILGNQLWIPIMSNRKYIGAVSFDRYDTTLYSSVEKFLISEAVNSLSTYIMKINAENANKAKSDFLSTMSHEIRTPMNAIVGMTEVALREDMPDSVKKNLKTVQSSAFGLLTLINDILDYSKIEAGRFEIVKESFSMLSMLNDLKEIVDARNNGKLQVKYNFPDNLPSRVYGDSVRIKQVMINFCTNAIKYSDDGEVIINILVDKNDDDRAVLRFSVKDNGIGIRKEDLSKLFNSYTRLDTTVNHHKEGTGLGLAISKQLIDLMDGRVAVESEYGKGSTFSFKVPVRVDDWTPAGSLDSYKYEDDKNDEESVVTAPNARILVVDDTLINLVVAEALLNTTGIQVDTAESGEDALKLIEANEYDLVFMDHFMPGMDGVETTEKIRALQDTTKSNLPVIALTADAMAGVKEELMSKGMNDFLSKPIIVKEMYQVLRKWLPKDKILS